MTVNDECGRPQGAEYLEILARSAGWYAKKWCIWSLWPQPDGDHADLLIGEIPPHHIDLLSGDTTDGRFGEQPPESPVTAAAHVATLADALRSDACTRIPIAGPHHRIPLQRTVAVAHRLTVYHQGNFGDPLRP